MGVSPVHAENIGIVRNLWTGYLSPQYHLIFDDWFETVYANGETVPESWDSMCIFEHFETAFEEGEAPTLGPKWYTSDKSARGNPPSVHPPQQELYHRPKAKGVRSSQLFTPRELL
jgi:hypothetical protein